MKLESIPQLAVVCLLTLALSATAFGQNQSANNDPNKVKQPKTNKAGDRSVTDDHVIGATKDEEKQAKRAATSFKEIMKTPSRGIPQSVIDRAQCVAFFPEVYKSGSVPTGRGGRGLVSCRTGSGWSAPVYLNIHSDALGSQIGPNPTEVVMVFMNKDAMSPLLNGKLTVGTDVSAAAGPVGRDPGNSADPAMNAQTLCYSRSKGVISGMVMDGAVIEINQDDNKDVYGANFNSAEILGGSKTNVRSKVMAFSDVLSRYTPRQAMK